MSIQDSPNRVVRTKDSTVAFIGHNLQANEDVLIEAIVDAASNEVKWRSSSKARKGIDYVEANESLQGIIDASQPVAGEQVEPDQSAGEVSSQNSDPADADQDGTVTKAERKQYKREHPDG